MIGSLRDPEHHEVSVPDELSETHVESPASNVSDYRPPVLGVVISFILLFWGSILLAWVFWPR